MTHSLARKFHCPVELALEVLGGKWKTVLLAYLKEQPRTYGELRGLVPRLSDKMLTQRLADLVEHGLVTRTRGARAVYTLTPRGASLVPVLGALYAFGQGIAGDVGAIIEAPPVTRTPRASVSVAGRAARPRRT